jgi:NAD(P)-dependent dehydrogenase (short-subunit alcohol dehydrogenase family)
VAQECADKIVASGGEAIAIAGDVTEPGHSAHVVAETVRRWGAVDVLVNNAVKFNQQGVLTMPYAEFSRQVEVILGGAFLFTQAVAASMVETGTRGSIINVLSTAAWQGQPGNIGYSTGKSGLVNFTRSAAMELAEHGIRVNGFSPTVTVPDDPETRRRIEELMNRPGKYAVDFAAQFPMGRLPTPADYVGTVVFLASEDSAMVTGTHVVVDGGATAKYWPWTPHPEAGHG